MFQSKLFTVINVLTMVCILAALALMVLELHGYGAIPFIDK